MQHYQLALVKTKQETRSSFALEIGANFPKTVVQTTHKRHSDGPTKLHPHQILTDSLPILYVECPQPIAHWLLSCSRSKKPNRYFRDQLWQRPSPDCTIIGTLSRSNPVGRSMTREATASTSKALIPELTLASDSVRAQARVP